MASSQRILTTHVGSLIRPDDLIAFLKKIHDGETYDAAAFQECLKRSVAEVVRKQVEVGIDIVSDGEFGKTVSWSRYILDRISGFEERQGSSPGFRSAVAGKDRRDFADFYEEYERNFGFVGMGKNFRTGTILLKSVFTFAPLRCATSTTARISSATKFHSPERTLPTLTTMSSSVAPSAIASSLS